MAKKEGHLTKDEKLNQTYCWVAIDAETKLVPPFTVGKRNTDTALEFIASLKDRLNGHGRIQLTTEEVRVYEAAIHAAFGRNIDYAQQIKCYASVNPGSGRYSPPRVSEVVSTTVTGNPDERHISTAFVERQNLTMRMAIKRFASLTLVFSKKIENLRAAVALHFCHYNFVRVPRSLRVTPAMAAGLTHTNWNLED